MKTFALVLLTCALILLSVSFVFSQPEQSGKRLADARGGYSFAAPTGFDAKQNDEGFALVNTAQTVLIAVKAHEFHTFEEFTAQSNLQRDGFTPIGSVQAIGNKGKAFRVYKQVPQGNLIVDTFVLFSPFGGGTLVVAFSDDANNNESFQTGLQVANSVAFTKIERSAGEDQWQMFLRGKHLISVSNSAGGYSERRDIYLCPSGKFRFGSESLSNSINGTGRVGSGSDGNWEISSRGGARLILRYRDGRSAEYKISRRPDPDVIELDGTRYLVKTFAGCP